MNDSGRYLQGGKRYRGEKKTCRASGKGGGTERINCFYFKAKGAPGKKTTSTKKTAKGIKEKRGGASKEGGPFCTVQKRGVTEQARTRKTRTGGRGNEHYGKKVRLWDSPGGAQKACSTLPQGATVAGKGEMKEHGKNSNVSSAYSRKKKTQTTIARKMTTRDTKHQRGREKKKKSGKKDLLRKKRSKEQGPELCAAAREKRVT